jgi:hypothetical protein
MRQVEPRKSLGIGIVLGLTFGATGVYVAWRFPNLGSDTRHALAAIAGVLGVIVGAAMMALWWRAPVDRVARMQGVLGGGVAICGGAMALLWSADRGASLQTVLAIATVAMAAATWRLRRRMLRESRTKSSTS